MSEKADSLTKKEQRALKREQLLDEMNRVESSEKMKRIGVWLLVFLGVVTLVWGFFKLVVRSSSVSVEPSSINDSDWVKGNRQAKVVIIEYSDFQCPACKYYQPFIKQLTEEYKDKIAFVYRHFPLRQIHKNAQVAAQTSEAAGQQGKFWEMHDVLFDNQEEWSEKTDAIEIFKEYARKLQLDLVKFETDMKSSLTLEKVEKDSKGGISIGINATPTFYINGIKLNNIRNYNDLKTVVDNQLNKN